MADEKAGRPVPKPSVYVDTKPFWDGAKAGKLVLAVLQGHRTVSALSAPCEHLHRQPESRMARSVGQGHDLRLHGDPRSRARVSKAGCRFRSQPYNSTKACVFSATSWTRIPTLWRSASASKWRGIVYRTTSSIRPSKSFEDFDMRLETILRAQAMRHPDKIARDLRRRTACLS